MNTTTSPAFTPGPLSFDGCGINGGDQYASRIATFVERGGANAKHYGPLFQAAPMLFEALQSIEAILTQPVQFTRSSDPAISILRTDAALAVKRARAALALVKGEVKP